MAPARCNKLFALIVIALPLFANASINKVARSPGLLDTVASPVNNVAGTALQPLQAAGVPDLGVKKITKEVTKSTKSATAPVKDVVGMLGVGNAAGGILKRSSNSSCRRKKGGRPCGHAHHNTNDKKKTMQKKRKQSKHHSKTHYKSGKDPLFGDLPVVGSILKTTSSGLGQYNNVLDSASSSTGGQLPAVGNLVPAGALPALPLAGGLLKRETVRAVRSLVLTHTGRLGSSQLITRCTFTCIRRPHIYTSLAR